MKKIATMQNHNIIIQASNYLQVVSFQLCAWYNITSSDVRSNVVISFKSCELLHTDLGTYKYIYFHSNEKATAVIIQGRIQDFRKGGQSTIRAQSARANFWTCPQSD